MRRRGGALGRAQLRRSRAWIGGNLLGAGRERALGHEVKARRGGLLSPQSGERYGEGPVAKALPVVERNKNGVAHTIDLRVDLDIAEANNPMALPLHKKRRGEAHTAHAVFPSRALPTRPSLYLSPLCDTAVRGKNTAV